MSKTRKIAIFLIITLIIGGGAFLLLNQKSNNSFVEKEISIKQAEVISGSDVYEDYAGFSFEYPAELKVEAIELDDDSVYSSLEILASDGNKLTLRVADTKYKSLKDWQTDFEDKNVIVQIKDVFFSDLDAKTIIYGAPKRLKTVAIENQIIYDLTGLADDGFIEKVHDEIISSFQFKAEVFVEEVEEELEVATNQDIVLLEETIE